MGFIIGTPFSASGPSNGLLTGLVSYYELNGDATDAHGSNNGTSTNITRDSSISVLGGESASFNNSTSKIALGDPYSANISMSCRVRPGSFDAGKNIISKDGVSPAADREYTMFFSGTGNQQVIFALSSGSTTFSIVITSSSLLSVDTRAHIVSTYDGTTGKLYVNGVLNGTDSTGTGNIVDGSATLTIGNSPAGAGSPFDGHIDEVGFWNTTLTQDQVTSLYNSGSGLSYSSFTS